LIVQGLKGRHWALLDPASWSHPVLQRYLAEQGAWQRTGARALAAAPQPVAPAALAKPVAPAKPSEEGLAAPAAAKPADSATVTAATAEEGKPAPAAVQDSATAGPAAAQPDLAEEGVKP
jgi:hypothetical protein